MKEHTKSEQIVNLDEEQIHAVTGGTGGRIQNFVRIPRTYDENMLLAQHEKEARQAWSDAEHYLIAGSEKQARASFNDAHMHYNMITHINNNLRDGLPSLEHEPPARPH